MCVLFDIEGQLTSLCIFSIVNRLTCVCVLYAEISDTWLIIHVAIKPVKYKCNCLVIMGWIVWSPICFQYRKVCTMYNIIDLLTLRCAERYTRRPGSTCRRYLSLRDTQDVLTARGRRYLSLRDTQDVLTARAGGTYHWEIHKTSWQHVPEVLITERYTRRPDSTCRRYLSLRDTQDVLTARAGGTYHWEIHKTSWQHVPEVLITERYTRRPDSTCHICFQSRKVRAMYNISVIFSHYAVLSDTLDVLATSAYHWEIQQMSWQQVSWGAYHWEIHQMSWQQVPEVFITERYTRCPGSKCLDVFITERYTRCPGSKCLRCLSLRDTQDVLTARARGVYHRFVYHYTPELSIVTFQNRYQLITCPSIKQSWGRNYFMRWIPKSNVHQGCITSACYIYCSTIETN